MATFAFPTNPHINDTYVVGSRTYRWTGYAWAIVTGTISTGNTSITGNAITTGNTTVTGNAVTTGNTTINNTGLTTGNTTVTGNSVTTGNTTITNTGLSTGNTTVTGNSVTTGNTTITDTGLSTGNTRVTGNAVTTGNTTINNTGLTTGNTTVTGNSVTTGNTTITDTGVTTGNTTVTGNSVTTGNTTITDTGLTTGNTRVTGNAISTGNTTITGTGLTTGNLTITGSVSLPNLFGNAVTLGTNSQGVFTSNAVNLTSTDSVTDSIAKLNQAISYMQPPFIPRGTDPSNWDQNLQLGMYSVKRDSWSATSGTPTEAYPTGLLTILSSDDVYVQKYQPNDTTSLLGAEFVRTRVGNGSWTTWARVVSEYGRLDGGTF